MRLLRDRVRPEYGGGGLPRAAAGWVAVKEKGTFYFSLRKGEK